MWLVDAVREIYVLVLSCCGVIMFALLFGGSNE